MAKLKDTRVYGNLTIDDVLLVSQDATVTGNLTVLGTTTTVNSTTVQVEGPIVQQGAGANGTALTSNDGKDRGLDLSYYAGGAQKEAFMGWNTSNSEFRLASEVSIAGDIVTFNTYGNLRAGHFIGEGDTLGNITGANVTGWVNNANNANYATTVTGASQSNITSVGLLTGLTVGNATANTTFGNGTITATGNNSSISATGNTATLTIGNSGNANSVANIYGDLNVTGNLTGRFTGTVGAKGTDTQVQFNDDGNQNATGGFTFTKSSNTVTIGGNITLNGDTGLANLSNINLPSTGTSNINGYDVNLYGSNSLLLQGDIGGHTKILLNSSGVNITTPVYGAGAVTIDTYGNLGVAGTANIAGGNLEVDQNGNVNAAGSGSFADVYITNASDSYVLYANGTQVYGDGTFTYDYGVTNTLTAGNLATYNANLSGNVTLSGHTAGNLLTTDMGGNVIDSNVSFSTGTLTVTNANVTANLKTSNLQVTSFTTTGGIPIADAVGNLSTSTGLTYSANTLNANNITTGGTANVANLQVTSLTTNEVPYADGTGTIKGNASFTYTPGTSTLAANNITASQTVQGGNLKSDALALNEVVFSDSTGVIQGNASFTYDPTSSTLTANTINAAIGFNSSNVHATNLINHAIVIADGTGKLVDDTANGFAYYTGNATLTANTVKVDTTLTAGNVLAGNIGNSTSLIYGDGGNLSNISADTAKKVANGTSNVNIATTNGNVTVGVAGNAAIATFTDTGVNVSGYLNVTGNITGANANLGNLVTANYVAGTLTTATQPNITSLGNLTSLQSNGNIKIDNTNTAAGILTDNLYYANGQPWDLQQAAGSTNYIQYNNGDNFDASANFQYDDTLQLLDLSGSANVTGRITAGNANVTNTLYFGEGSQLYDDGGLVIQGNTSVSIQSTGTNDISLTSNNHTVTISHEGNLTFNGNVSNLGNVVKANIAELATKVITPTVESPDSVDLTLTVNSAHTNGNIVLAPGATGVVEVSGKKITGLAEPTADNHAATKYYVDHVAQGLHVHGPVVAASTANISGFSGGTFTVSSPFVLDGYTVPDQGRVLIKNQVTQSQNGIYVYTAAGPTLTRADDSNSAAEFAGGDFCFVVNGDTQGDTGWVQTEVVTTLGSDPIIFQQFSGAGAYTADENYGMQLNGTVFRTKIDGYYAGTDPVTDPAMGTLEYDGAGNIRVADSAVFVSPNIGAATGTSLDLGTGNIVVGNVNATNLYGNGYTISNIAGANVHGNVAYANYAYHVDGANVNGEVSVANTVSASAQSNITSVGTLTSLDTSGNISIATSYGIKTDHIYKTDGTPWDFATANGASGEIQFSNGTDLASNASFTFDNSTGNLAVPGNIITGGGSGGNITGANEVHANYFYGDGSNLTGVVATSANAETLTGTYINSGVTGSSLTSVGQLGSLDVTGDITISTGNLYANSQVVKADTITANYVAGTLTTGDQPNISNVGTLGNLAVTNYANVGNIRTNAVSDTQVVYGNSNRLVGSAGFTFNATSNTLSTDNVVVSDTANVGNLTIAGAGTVTGNIIPSANVTYNLGNADHRFKDLYLSGTSIYLGAQTIESNATAITTTADVSAANIFDTGLSDTRLVFSNGDHKLVDSANLTFSGTELGVTGTANVSGTAVAGNLQSRGLTATRVTFAGTSGLLVDSANLTFSGTELGVTGDANISGNVKAGNIVDTALRTNQIPYTTTGNLLSGDTSFTYDGSLFKAPNATVSGNVIAGNLRSNALSSTQVVFAGSDKTLTSDTGFTYVSGTSTLTATNIVASTSANLGAVGNVTITGGADGQYLVANGSSGGLKWASVDAGMISNGTSNVDIAVANGNVTVAVAGGTVLNIGTIGMTVTGIITATGNITGANIISNAYVIASGTEDATSAITGAITTAGGISAQGNIYTGHAIGFANTPGSNTSSAAYIQFNSGSNSLDFIFN